MIVLGITGNIGMGKSTVAGMFEELGAARIDTDAIVSELLAEPEVQQEVKALFGDEVVQNGVLDRRRVAEEVFEDSGLRLALENVLHPMVFRIINDRLAVLARDEQTALVVVEAPVLFERSYQNRFDTILTVHTSEDVALERVIAKGMSRKDAESRLRCQFPIAMKKEKADLLVDNSGSPEETKEHIRRIYELLVMQEQPRGYN
ncbi:MAG TPA: dephospho-CoA kinase [Dissulfurispiraceae bacterium]|nr:dephospho-CoA kinase [Dissulfurispiraceae bacterium]